MKFAVGVKMFLFSYSFTIDMHMLSNSMGFRLVNLLSFVLLR